MPTAVITGPTAGIGRAFATALADRGHDLVLVARDVQRLDALAADLRARTGVATEVIAADLSSAPDLRVVEARLCDPSRPVDVLVNNAGFGIKQPFLRSSVDDEQRMIDVMVTAVMRTTHAVLPSMVQRGHGVILNVSSVASWLTGGTYSAAKAWVTVFSEGLHAELAGTGVRVTAVCPGFVHTEFHERALMDMSSVPAWMWLDADDVVRQALRDAGSNRAISVTGAQYKAMGALLRHGPRAMIRRIGIVRTRSGIAGGASRGGTPPR